MPAIKIKKLQDVLTGPTVMAGIEKYVQDNVEYLFNKTQVMRETLLPKWVKIYKGTPEVEHKTFPWPEASNLVIQLAATHADELLSRVMSIYQSEQLFIAQVLGDFEKGQGTEQGDMIERFMSDMSLSPYELDLYRVEEVLFGNAIRYGTGIVKIPYRFEEEEVYIGGESSFLTTTMVDGPRPENVPLNKFLIDTQRPTLRKANFISHIGTYHRTELQRFYDEAKADRDTFWKTDALKKLLDGSSDRQGPDYMQMQQETTKGMNNYTPAEVSDEWDIYECWFAYPFQGKRYRCIVHWHKKSNTFMGGLFNPYPENQIPFEDAKLAYDDDQYYGFGFMEMLESYQREVSTIHNQRIDNRNLANTGAMRVAPNSKLASILQVYPGVMIPGLKDEVEPLPLGNTSAPMVTDDEMLTLSLAKDRSGVDPAVGGTGGGIVNQKRGIYSAQGTAIAMQQMNNRNNLRMSDMRSAHVRIGIKILQQYASYGISSEILKRYGDYTPVLNSAVQAFKSGKLGLLIKPATASNNKELEKQNDILMLQTLANAQTQDLQMMAQMVTPGIAPDMVAYLKDCITAKNALLRRLLRNFEHPDVERLAPLPDFIKKEREQLNAQQENQSNTGSGASGSQQPLGGFGALPLSGGSTLGQLPQMAGGGMPSSVPQ